MSERPGARRLQAFAFRHPLLFGVAATLIWCGLVLAATRLPPHPLYGPMYVNAVGLAAGVALVAWLGWSRATGMLPLRPRRTALLILPLLALTATYAVPGIDPAAYLSEGIGPDEGWFVLLCLAGICLLVGLNEELWSRGIILHPLRRGGPWISSVAVALLFSAQHLLNLFAFGARLDDTIAQLVSTATFGFALAALRWHDVAILPLAVLHGLGNFLQLASPGAAPLHQQAAIAVVEVAYGVVLLRLASRRRPSR